MTADKVTVLILGAGGDLTKRLLLPGLASLLARYDYDVQVIGSGIGERSDEEWAQVIRDSFAEGQEHADGDQPLPPSRWITADATDADQLQELLNACDGAPVIYFALPPAVTAKVCAALAHLDLPEGTRLALEKPFGVDLASARKLNRLISRVLPEEDVYRIDHFLGMSTVLNILGLRFTNQLLEPVWNAGTIDRVEIVFDETLGLEGRGGYYDSAGALVDMLQSHLLEVLALVAMEAPPRVDERELRSNAAQVLRNTRVWKDDPVAASHRARYSAGTVKGRKLPSYADEEGVDRSRETETLAQVTFEVNTQRWRGVPFVLRSGKAIAEYSTEIRIVFKPVPPIPGLAGSPDPDRIVLDLLAGSVLLELTTNGTGDPFRLEQARLEAQEPKGELLPYGQVLRGILDGDPLLSVRGDIAEECWRIVTPVLDAWRANRVPLEEYPAGSAGPEGW
ncbi:MAG: glucose-6-phosphate dehydrogenase [Naasia sp.]|jgi:glucose-6-phosphate 1-dehydrogenase|uniref:glucose-6-phosphate dehydrogenase n=1 Tax=Naasia sp. TaxID=2546198 RepID=UPI0026377EDD|nr:glucose-6-phosphate dehydrogenase [Naasia sp.]MCU1569495.1 glucose-6-phosphate dehydrogenase [Naasia sp.]